MNTVKVSDYIIKIIEDIGIKHIFLISGGGNIHLVDSLSKSKKINYICNHHEQASSIAAEGYGRTTEKLGVCMVTTGPGGTNAITGVMGAWVDSIPMLVLSGQVKRETIGAGKALRQLGDQEINIIDIVRPITKYAEMVIDVNSIKYHLEKAIYLAKSGRPGPVWLDIPIDIQGAFVDVKKLKNFFPQEIKPDYKTDKTELKKLVTHIIQKIQTAERPVLLIGNGIRFSGMKNKLLRLIELLKIPVLTGYAGFDLVSPRNSYFAGHPGSFGQRTGNFTLQNSDVLLALGTRLNVRMTGFNFPSFARSAYKIMVDIDSSELEKSTLSINLKVNYDVKDFIREMIEQLKKTNNVSRKEKWMKTIKVWKEKYPSVPTEYWKQKKYVNPYCFIAALSHFITAKDGLALSNATSQIVPYQALQFPQGTRILNNSGCAAMGYGLPAAIGMCFARNKKSTICLEGDGSIQLNIQELQTIVNYKLPIKIFIFNNQGYVSIRLTQEGLFDGRLAASSNETGVQLPNMIKIAQAYGIRTEVIKNHKGMEKKIKKILQMEGPVLCDVLSDPQQKYIPKAASAKLPDGSFVSRPLEDMLPLLSRDELKENMVIPLWEQ